MTPDLQALLADVELRHTEVACSPHPEAASCCRECEELWPCDMVQLAAAVRELMGKAEDVQKIRDAVRRALGALPDVSVSNGQTFGYNMGTPVRGAVSRHEAIAAADIAIDAAMDATTEEGK